MPSFVRISSTLNGRQQQPQGVNEQPRIYLQGVLVAMSAPVVTFICALMFVLLLLLEMNAVLSVVLLPLQLYTFLRGRQLSDTQDTQWATIGVWFLMATQWFYTTGHQASFPTIQWTSGLVGMTDSSVYVSGFLVAYNTFASYIIMACALPLTVLWTPMSHVSTDLQADRVGEFWLHTKGRTKFEHRLSVTTLMYLCAFGVCTFISMCAATVLRRHLMVWKIFAPRVIYDCIDLVVTCVSLVLMMLFLLRVRHVLSRADQTMSDLVKHIETRKTN